MSYRKHDIIKDQRVLTGHKLLPNTIKDGSGDYYSPLLDSDGTQIVKIVGGTAIDEVEGLLNDIKTNTANINVNVGDVEINVNDLEVLQTATNVKLTSIDTRLDNSIGAINNLSNIGSGSSVLKSSCLGVMPDGNARIMLLDANGKLEVSNTTVLSKLTEIDTAIDTIDSVLDASLVKHTNNETLITSSNTKLDTLETTLTAIETSVQLIDNSVDGNYLNTNLNIQGGDVDSSSGNLSVKTQRVCIATDDIPIALINTKLDTLETSLTAIETAVQLLDNCVAGNELQVDIVSGGGGTAPTHGSVDVGSSLEDNELSPVIDTNGYCEISIHFAVNESGDSQKKLNVMGSTAEGGSYFTFAMLYLDNNSSYSGDGADEKNYCYRTGTNELTGFIPCAYRYIKIKNTTGTIITGIDGDDIRYIMKV